MIIFIIILNIIVVFIHFMPLYFNIIRRFGCLWTMGTWATQEVINLSFRCPFRKFHKPASLIFGGLTKFGKKKKSQKMDVVKEGQEKKYIIKSHNSLKKYLPSSHTFVFIILYKCAILSTFFMK